MFAHLFSKISIFKILSLSFSLIILVFLFFLLLSKEFNQKSLAAGPVIYINPKSLDFGEVYKNQTNRLRLLVCNFDAAVYQITAFNFLNSTGKFSVNPVAPQNLLPANDSGNVKICDSWDAPMLELIIEFKPNGAIAKFSDILRIITTDPNEPNKDINLQGKSIDTNTQRAKTWLEVQYGDVYAIGDLYAEYTDTATSVDYRLITGSTIQDWESSINAIYEQSNSFISSFPDSNNNFTVSVGSVDVEGLITDLGGFNMYGYAIDDAFAPSGYLGSDLTNPTDPAKPLGLNYQVCPGDLVIGDNVFSNGAGGEGSELIVAKGNIYIIGDTYYSAERPAKIEDLASLGFMALKRTESEKDALPADCKFDDCGTDLDCYAGLANQYGGNIYLVDVHNLKTNNDYIVGVDYNIFNLTDGNIEANKNYCAETGEHPGKKTFDLDGSMTINGPEEIYLGWDDYFGNSSSPGYLVNPDYAVYNYCQQIETPQLDPSLPGFPVIISYNINDTLSPNPDTMTVAPIHIVGTYYAEGSFHSGKAKLPLIIEGLVMAQSFHLEREAIVQNPSGALSPSEIFVYDGRAILNPPPGFRELINERFNFSLVKP